MKSRTDGRLVGAALLIQVVSLCIFSQRAHAQTAPVVVDLGTLGGYYSTAIAVNATGFIVGNSQTATGAWHAFLWTSNGGMVDLGTLGGVGSEATAVNALGHVAGNSQTQSGDTHAFVWTPSMGMIDLGTLPGSTSSNATALNDSDQVVGWTARGFAGDIHGFSWTPTGGMIDIGTIRGLPASFPTALNASGQVVGFSTTGITGSPRIAFLWTAVDGMTDLGVLPGFEQSQANDVNDAGQVVGESFGSTLGHAFSWTAAGGMTDLGTLPGFESSYGRQVNAAGQVVGINQSSSRENRAFSWTTGTGMIDLGTLGGSFSNAQAVNAKGQVVGSSGTPSGDGHAFVWTAAAGMVDLGTLGGDSSAATALNERGDVVGASGTWTGARHATLWIGKFIDSPPERLLVHNVQASSTLTSVFDAYYAGDSDPLTRWSSEFTDSQFIQVDLGEDTPFDRIVLWWELARAAEYEIQVSSDGKAWSTRRRVVASGDVDDLFDLGGSARYVRMQGLRRATHWGYSLFEFEVYRNGLNIAAGRPMTASSSERVVFPAGFAVDGDPSTRWMSQFADEQWFAVDLGATVALDRVVLKWDAGYAADYELLVSDDASSWRTIRTVTDADGGTDDFIDLGARGRYAGLLLHRRGTPWGFSLWEFEAYGSPTGIAP